MNDILNTAIHLAEHAGEITLRYFQTDVQVEIKEDRSPVTLADQKAEEFIRSEIHRQFPADGIVGEEHGTEEGASGRRWIIDPIDGTQSFIRDVPLYGVLIAVEWEGCMQVGVMRFPALGITVSAQKGGGCFLNGKPCRVSSVTEIEKAAIMVTSYPEIMQHQGSQAVLNLLEATAVQRTWGDCYGYHLLASGKVEAMIDPVVKIWDVAPLLPIIREAGGKITDIHGNESEEITSVIAGNGRFHDRLVALFES